MRPPSTTLASPPSSTRTTTSPTTSPDRRPPSTARISGRATTTRRPRPRRTRTSTRATSSPKSSASSATAIPNRSVVCDRPDPADSKRQNGSTPPDRRADLVELGRELLAVDRGERHRRPPLRAGRRRGQVVRPEPADVATLERVPLELPADRPAEEHQHVHAEAGETHPLAVDDRQDPLGNAFDAGLLADLLHRHLGR